MNPPVTSMWIRNIDIKSEYDIVVARQVGRDMARDLGFGIADQTRLATAISELTRNVIRYAKEGRCEISDTSDGQETRVRVVVEDHGPGIADIKKAMTMGYSTGKGLGAGLPGSQRLVHHFEIQSEPGHTKVTIMMRRRKS